jgi:hypothetical protein
VASVDVFFYRPGVPETMTDRVRTRGLAVYLAGVVGLGAVTVTVLLLLFRSGFSAFLSALTRDPEAAVRADPGTVALVFVSVGLVVSLFVLVVVFGAQYGPEPEHRETERD